MVVEKYLSKIKMDKTKEYYKGGEINVVNNKEREPCLGFAINALGNVNQHREGRRSSVTFTNDLSLFLD